MKNLISENWKFKPSKELTTRDGRKVKKVYIQGKTKELNQHLKDRAEAQGQRGGILKTYPKIKLENKPVYKGYFVYINPEEDGSYDYEKVRPDVEEFIRDAQRFYNITVDLDQMIEDLKNYVPNEDDEDAPTQEEVDAAANKLDTFKEEMLSLATSEELFEKLKLISDIKSADSTGNFSKLTPNNLWLVKTQKPDATIVMNKGFWKKFFNRTINEGATRIIIRKGNPIKYDSNITNNFLASKGKSNQDELSGAEKLQLQNLQKDANWQRNKEQGIGYQGSFTTYYDYSDTTQIEGTEDTITPMIQDIIDARAKSEEAREKLRAMGGVDTVQPNTAKGEKISSVYKGLVAYKDDQGVNLPGFNPKENPTAGETKHLAKTLLSGILHNKDFVKGFAQRFYVGNVGQEALRQQAEIASWMFMHGMGVDFKPEQIDQTVAFSGKDMEERKRNMNSVYKQVEAAVKHLKEFVDIETGNISETQGIDFKMPSWSEVAREFGFTELLNNTSSPEEDIQELYESITRKLKRRL